MPITFSEQFNISKEVLEITGVFDVILDIDTRVFIDPALLELCTEPEFLDARKKVEKYFSDIITLLRHSKSQTDMYRKRAERMLPSLNKSTYGFCGHKYRPTLRVALTGASLPTAPRFLWRHFSRAKTPQDFSARENRMMTRKRTPAYWRMLLRGPRKVVRPRGERRSDEALEGCLFRRNSAPT